jgi:hypothetical protein
MSTYRHSDVKNRGEADYPQVPLSSPKPREVMGLRSHVTRPQAADVQKLDSGTLVGVVGFAPSDFSQEVRMKKVLLVLTLVGLGFLAWRYFSNEPV